MPRGNCGRIKSVLNLNFWKNRRILLTGHTGFKGSWMALFLEALEAKTVGISLPAATHPSLFEILSPWPRLDSHLCDIRDHRQLQEMITRINPEIVIHMAAQPLVRQSYLHPLETIESNVMGTVYLLETLRNCPALQAVLVITSDKVYANQQNDSALTENAALGGRDPYSASKACTEILTKAYSESYFADRQICVFTARAGNVIGGGDWAEDRLIPDLWRAYVTDHPVALRYPNAVRPWQHVFDPLYGYLKYIEAMLLQPLELPTALNFGPSDHQHYTVKELAEHFAAELEHPNLFKMQQDHSALKETSYLSIDANLAKKTLDWEAKLKMKDAMSLTSQWYKFFLKSENMRKYSLKQIDHYLSLFPSKESQNA